MPIIRAKKDYYGRDIGTGDEFRLYRGQSREVSEEKVEQLRRDFPEQFEFEGLRKGRRGRPPKNAEPSGPEPEPEPASAGDESAGESEG